MPLQLRNLTPVALLILLAVILRFPSFFEPYWYGDELIRLLVAHEWFAGKTLYWQIYDNSPPVLYIIFGTAPNIFWLKILAGIWAVAATTIFYFLASNLGKSVEFPKIYPVLATIIFILTASTPILEGNLAAAEIFALLPALAGIFLVWRKSITVTRISLIVLAGVLFAFATLIRIQAVTDFATAALFLLIIKKFRSFFTLSFAFAAVWVATFLIFIATGNWQGFFTSVFLGNFDYVNFANQLVIPFGLIILKILGLILVLAVLLKTKKFLNNVEFLIILWLIFSFFGALVGGRGYAHYFLQVTPATALILAQTIRLFKFGNFARFAPIFLRVLALLILATFHSRPFSYYKNFLNFFYDYPAYVDWFDPRVRQSEIIAGYIRQETKTDDEIFVLGNSPEIYLLSQRKPAVKYVVSYHLNFQPNARGETLSKLSQKPARLVVVFEEGRKDFPDILPFLDKNYNFLVKIGKGEIWIHSL